MEDSGLISGFPPGILNGGYKKSGGSGGPPQGVLNCNAYMSYFNWNDIEYFIFIFFANKGEQSGRSQASQRLRQLCAAGSYPWT